MSSTNLNAQTPSPSAQIGSQRRALLIGVTDFQELRLRPRSLKGPANDVDLFKEVLERGPLAVPAANIRVLKGTPADPALRPTHSNIQREFARLAELSRNGDQIVILMAGHGSQQPADNDPNDDEPDGLDEIFLPADTSGWDGTVGRVKNAVVDDEIRKWVTTIRNKGAFVWLIFDSCQSGTMARGLDVERQIPMSDLVPATAINAAARRAGRREDTAENNIVGLADSAGDIAALYAAHTSETTPEKPLPNTNSPIHGLFTYTIANILSQSSSAMTYRELALRVLEQYRSIPRFSPTPLFEGGGLDREILGQRTWPDRPQMLLDARASDGTWRLRAGSVHGLSVGSILELFPPAGGSSADKSVGYLKVTSVEPTSARVVPTRFDDVAAPSAARLVPASRARVTYHELGDLRLKVALQQPDRRQSAGATAFTIIAPGRGPAAIERALADLPKSSNGLAERVSSPAADWFVRLIDNQVVLVPAEGWQPAAVPPGGNAKGEVPRQFVIGPIGDPNVSVSLGSDLRKIGRARNLMRLANTAGSGPHVDLRVIRYAGEHTTDGRPLFSKPGDVVIRAGEFAEFRVKNTGDQPVDVTVLHIDARFGIQSLFPLPDSDVDNQVKPGENRIIGRFPVGIPTGWESAVAIAVESTMMRQNFNVLAQDSLEAVRGSSSRGPQSALQRLIEDAVLGSGTNTRGIDVNPGKFVAKLVTWRTDPAAK